MSTLATELKVAEPEVDVALVADTCKAVDIENSSGACEIGDRFLPLLFILLLIAIILNIVILGGVEEEGFLAELSEGIEVGFVVNVGEVIFLERTWALETVLEMPPLLHNL